MLRSWLAAGATLLLGLTLWFLPAPAKAAAFPDVPTDHWAYEAVQYMQDKGFVEGYPDGEFKGNRTLTRYEFAIVIARVYDKLVEEFESGEIAPDVDAIYQRLEDEFAADIADLREMIENNDERLAELETAFGGISTRMDKTDKSIADLLGKVGSVKLSGDLRTRFEWIEPDDEDADPTKRARIRLRLKGDAKVNDDIKATLRLATGGSGEITSTNETLEDYFALDPFQLDQAYLTWAPPNASDRLDPSKKVANWSVTAGKFAPNWQSTLITFDSDVNVEGIGENFFMNDEHWRVNLAQLVPGKSGFYLVNQLGYKDLLLEGFELYGTFHYMNTEALQNIRRDTTATGSTLKNQITWSDFDTESNYTQWEILARYNLAKLFSTEAPLILTGNYVQSSYDPLEGGRDEWLYKAAYANLTYGQLTNPGDWRAWIEWGRIQPNAVITLWSDSDRGEGNTDFYAGGLSYLWLPNVELAATYIDHKRFINSDAGFGRLQLDAIAKF